ncbi:MAG TPA: cell division protein FtsZ [Polyangiaceae bacterium LLY-WYZ-15_(1-7)]|nr:cell division protein FtsZ [Polyangiaceae bacterium LLY-WYZ-15_(1-7)]
MERFDACLEVVGVGGAGGNALVAMQHADVQGVRKIVANTDAQALRHVSDSADAFALRLGERTTRGLGAGGRPSVGAEAAIESQAAIGERLKGADLVFVTAGMGGGTGTGAAPVIAELAREAGAITVGVVTTPFRFEGRRRQRFAEQGLEHLEPRVDALLVIDNERLLEGEGGDLDLQQAFRRADEVLCDGVRGIAELLTANGLINLDFADVREVLQGGGRAVLGVGEASVHQGGAAEATLAALRSPLLADDAIAGAQAWLLNLTVGPDVKLHAVHEAAMLLEEAAHEDADVAFGVITDPRMTGRVRATAIATRFAPPAPAAQPGRRNALVMLG